MKRIRFYRCAACGNVITGTGDAELICCGRKVTALQEQQMDDTHQLQLEDMDGEYYITLNHNMTKEHFIPFVAWASFDRVMLVRLYPEQGGELRIPQIRGGGKLYLCCSRDGLFEVPMK